MSASIFMEHIEPQRRMLNKIERRGQDAFTPLVDNIEKSTDEAVIMVMVPTSFTWSGLQSQGLTIHLQLVAEVSKVVNAP